MKKNLNMKVEIADLVFKNPIIAASGTFGFGREYSEFYDLSILGGICTKGLTLERREGNDVPRLAETPCGMLNSVGLQNPGIDYFLAKELPFLKKYDTVVIANIAGRTEEEYCEIAWRLSTSSIDAVELNISCPNVSEGGMTFGAKPESVFRIVEQVRNHCIVPLIVKLTPNVQSIAEVAKAAEEGGADAISLINTVSGMAVNYKTRRPVLANKVGGLSGPAIKPIALKMVHDAYGAVKIPIIGLGGISSAIDVFEFMLCGARAVQLGTIHFSNPNAGKTILDDLTKLLDESNISDINSIVGRLEA